MLRKVVLAGATVLMWRASGVAAARKRESRDSIICTASAQEKAIRRAGPAISIPWARV